MSFTIPEELSLIVSSNPNNGARNVSPDGSYFEVQLEDGLKIPSDALNVNISLEEATIWWSVPNVIEGVNNKFYITGPNTLDVISNFLIELPQGLYDLGGMNSAVARELEKEGAKFDPDPLITLSPDEATQKVQIRFNYANSSVDFKQPDTPREILGFDSEIILSSGDNPRLADNVAAFNSVNYFLVHSDLTNKGIRFNNQYSQTIGQVLIDVPPGSQIVSRPFNPAKVNAPELSGSIRTSLKFWITDDQNRRINTNNEYWSARIVIHYLRPFVVGRPT